MGRTSMWQQACSLPEQYSGDSVTTPRGSLLIFECSYEPLISKLIREYQLYWTPEEKSRWLTQNLRLRQPCHAERKFQQVPESSFALSVTGTVPVVCAELLECAPASAQ